MRIRRFTPAQRAFHVLLLVTFLWQSLTGLARMYHETSFGQTLAALLGGQERALVLHIWGGMAMLVLFALHLAYLAAVALTSRRALSGPDSLIPKTRDLTDFFRHLGWMFGLAKAPRFERWGYWEKFDYWAVFWGMVIIGGTGAMLISPLFTSLWLPGWSLNVAFWVHRIEAVLAMGHVFIIHFFVAHLRRHNFPMDRAMFAGGADLRAQTEERPAWVERLRSEGRLSALTMQDAPAPARVASYALGLSAVAVGVWLIVQAVRYAPLVTWWPAP